jgi:hypothetical protein
MLLPGPRVHADGKKHIKLSGKWNAFVNMVPCDEEGNVVEGQEPTRMWTCNEKPKGDYYTFTNFAHQLNGCEGMREPLPSDSRWVVLVGCIQTGSRNRVESGCEVGLRSPSMGHSLLG